MWAPLFIASCTVVALVSGQGADVQPWYPPSYPNYADRYPGPYCAALSPSQRCCNGRRDECSTKIDTTRCYCDSFCNQHGPNRDCCPDYEKVCHIPGPERLPGCTYDGIHYNQTDRFRLRDDPCLTCTCTKDSAGLYELHCDYACTPKPHGNCRYGGIEYPAGAQMNIGDSCYSCTCKGSSWYEYSPVSLICKYTCSPPPPTYRCLYKDRFLSPGETVQEPCQICTCVQKAPGAYGMECRHDPRCVPECYDNGQRYPVGSRIRKGLQECTCTQLADRRVEFTCVTYPPPTPEPVSIVDYINRGNYGWKAYGYSWLIDRTMEEVFRLRTGVCRPETQVIAGAPRELDGAHYYPAPSFQQDVFDARTQWPGYVRPISDAGDQPISWAITTADLAADRRAILSNGRDNLGLSSANLVSCVEQSAGHCSSTLKGWEYLRNYGIVSEECYPRNSHSRNLCLRDYLVNDNLVRVTCPSGRGEVKLVKLPPHYRVSTQEMLIRQEIRNNGPVQAHIRVREDFFYYRSGVYRHVHGNLHNNREHYLAVRIIGWGTDISSGHPVHYWICANSWGTNWGETGYFRILRGSNECQVEEYVYGVRPN